jgi:hypothetical protein
VDLPPQPVHRGLLVRPLTNLENTLGISERGMLAVSTCACESLQQASIVVAPYMFLSYLQRAIVLDLANTPDCKSISLLIVENR